MFDHGFYVDYAGREQYDGEMANMQEDHAHYLEMLRNGMCPACGSPNTVRIAYQYQACSERYCNDCGDTYCDEW